ncbi:copper chaperone PCu(A)C [Novosphingobium terrae]|uniref:copper chaperone PCu(A)C n=1 Tax=Novosphingobium terrae TaxID=2726189 RepID=UPI00197DD6D4|nr:copper chaperone PCu(A)C [Novosphingobium terrae]
MFIARFTLPLLALASLAACHKGEEAPTSAAVSESAAAPTPTAENTAPSGRLVLPVIPGRPAAAYVTWCNTGPAPVTITGVVISSAKTAEMHETKGTEMAPLPRLKLDPGDSTNFAPGGRHVMVFGLRKTVKAGDSIGFKLVLEDGRRLVGSLKVEAAGATPEAAHDDMAGMKM